MILYARKWFFSLPFHRWRKWSLFFKVFFFEIFLQGFSSKFFFEIFFRDFSSGFFFKIFLWDFFSRFFFEIFLRDFSLRFFFEIFLWDFSSRFFFKIFLRDFSSSLDFSRHLRDKSMVFAVFLRKKMLDVGNIARPGRRNSAVSRLRQELERTFNTWWNCAWDFGLH